MVRSVVIATALSLVALPGCRDSKRPAAGQQSAAARAQCDREAGTNEPGSRGTLVGAFDTDVKAVKAEYRRLYRKDWGAFGDGGDEPLVLCYYDVPPEIAALSPPGQLGPIERISIIVDAQLNSDMLHGGPMAAVPVRAIG